MPVSPRSATGTVRRAALLAVPLSLALLACAVESAEAQSATEPWTVSARKAARKNPIALSDQVLARGAELFRRECETCHGASGRGDGEKAAELTTAVGDLTSATVQEQKDGALFWKITEGRGDMPTNLNTLTEEERWMVVHYIRTLAAVPDAHQPMPRPQGGVLP